MATRIKGTLLERLMGRVTKEPGGCWLWTGSTGSHGYGQITIEGKPKLAHRIAYTLLVGPIPEGHDLHHPCKTRRCINPDHLVAATRQQHKDIEWPDGRPKREACRRGHPYTPPTHRLKKNGSSVCLVCKRMNVKAWRATHPDENRERRRKDRVNRRLKAIMTTCGQGRGSETE